MHVLRAALGVTLLAATIITLGYGSAAIAGPFEDADTAYKAGDYQTAMHFWRPLADQGHARAQYNLGKLYFLGEGVPLDNAQCRYWWLKAADQDHVLAQFNLANMYYFGNGVSKNTAEALKWYRRAAGQGYARAQFNLGLMYRLGEGVSQDVVQAYKWWSLAAAQGNEDAGSNQTALARTMTREQVAKAKQLTSEWRVEPN